MSFKIELNDAYKAYTFDQDKILSPEDTVKRFKKKLRKVNLDILKRTVRIDNRRLDIPVYYSLCGEDACNIRVSASTVQTHRARCVKTQVSTSVLVRAFIIFSP